MIFYCGVNDMKWNHHPVRPGRYACIAPIYGRTEKKRRPNRVRIPSDTLVIQDSGAFSDSRTKRLSNAAALDRQLAHAERFNYASQVTHRASYDLLIDEKWHNGQRSKQRWSEGDAWQAVAETVAAAEYLARNYQGGRVQSAQGVTPGQYLDCAAKVLEWFDPATDIFGLGGWCISGLMPTSIRPSFNATMLVVIPFLARASVNRVHIWGVSDVTFLGPLLWLCDQHGLKLSTDSSAPQVRPTKGVWGFRGWYKEGIQPPVASRGIWRIMLVKLYRCRLATLRQSAFYHHPDMPDGKEGQCTLFST